MDNSGEGALLAFWKGLYRGEYYTCPCCQNRNIVSCGTCGRISCWDGGKGFTCAHCGSTSEVTGIIQSAQTVKHLPYRKK